MKEPHPQEDATDQPGDLEHLSKEELITLLQQERDAKEASRHRQAEAASMASQVAVRVVAGSKLDTATRRAWDAWDRWFGGLIGDNYFSRPRCLM